MTIKKFNLQGLDQTANIRILTTDNLTSNVVLSALTVALTGSNLIAGGNTATGATGATGPEGGSIFEVTNSGFSAYTVNGSNNPTLNLIRGFTYYFNVSALGHPFWIKNSQTTGISDAYTSGITNNGIESGQIKFSVPFNAPDNLYYICQFHGSMKGNILVSNQGPIGATGIGIGSRITNSTTTGTLSDGASENITISAAKGYIIYKVASSHAAWIRIYSNSSARTSDQSRVQGTDPTPDSGVILEVITNSLSQTINITPAVLGFNDDNPVTATIPARVTNLSGSNNTITVGLTLVKTEE